MCMDISDYGFLKFRIFTFSDFLIIARFIIFVPLCIYEGCRIYKCAEKEKKEGIKKRRRHSHRHHKHSKSSSNTMDAEYEKRTFFMDTEALLKKQLEQKSLSENKATSEE